MSEERSMREAAKGLADAIPRDQREGLIKILELMAKYPDRIDETLDYLMKESEKPRPDGEKR